MKYNIESNSNDVQMRYWSSDEFEDVTTTLKFTVTLHNNTNYVQIR